VPVQNTPVAFSSMPLEPRLHHHWSRGSLNVVNRPETERKRSAVFWWTPTLWGSKKIAWHLAPTSRDFSSSHRDFLDKRN